MRDVSFMLLVQFFLSFIVIIFAISQLAGNEKPDQAYWVLLSSTVAYWFPSPLQAVKKQ